MYINMSNLAAAETTFDTIPGEYGVVSSELNTNVGFYLACRPQEDFDIAQSIFNYPSGPVLWIQRQRHLTHLGICGLHKSLPTTKPP